MEVRLVQLLASFISVSADYALARLEFALRDPSAPAPPVIERLPDASEESLRGRWPLVEAQLDAALAYAKHLPPPAVTTMRKALPPGSGARSAKWTSTRAPFAGCSR